MRSTALTAIYFALLSGGLHSEEHSYHHSYRFSPVGVYAGPVPPQGAISKRYCSDGGCKWAVSVD